MRRPAFFLAASLLAGAILGRIVAAPLWLLALCLVGAVVALVVVYRRIGGVRFPERTPLVAAAVATVVLAGLLEQSVVVRGERHAEAVLSRLERGGVWRIEGTVAGEPAWRGEERDRLSLVLRDVTVAPVDDEGAGERFPGRIQVSLLRSAAKAMRGREPVRGERLVVRAIPSLAPTAPYATLFDYRAFLHVRGISGQAFVWQGDRVRRLRGGSGLERAVFSRVAGVRRGVNATVENLLPPERQPLMRAILLGDTGGFPEAMRDAFIRTGLAHLFAVSGLHTALVALLVYGVCRILLLPRRFSAWVMIAALCCFALVVGFRPSVVRAGVMAGFLALPILTRRAVDRLQALCLAAALTMFLDPHAPFRSDFQFSYVCAFGILVLGGPLRELLEWHPADRDAYWRRRMAHWWNRWGAMPLAAVIAVQLVCAPLLSIYYQQFSLVAPLANVAFLPVAAVLLYAGWIVVAVAPLMPGVAGLAGPFLSGVSGAFLQAVDALASVSGVAVPLPPFPWWLVGATYLVLLGGAHMRPIRAPGALERSRARFLLRVAGVVAVLVWWPVWSGGGSGWLECAMLDVGQGDCLVLHAPNGRTMMVDTGPPGASDTVLGYLRSRGIGEVSALILTHPDADHVGGAARILDSMYVRRVFESSHRMDTQVQLDLDAALLENGTPLVRLCRGMRLYGLGDVEVSVLHPSPEGDAGRASNDLSVVLLVDYGEIEALFTGDAPSEVERELLRTVGADALEAEILKVSHHGSDSATSPAFLEAVHPVVALIGVGRNSYGHPREEVLARLREAGAEIRRTDLDGTVEWRTDGRRIVFRTHRKRAVCP